MWHIYLTGIESHALPLLIEYASILDRSQSLFKYNQWNDKII